MVTNYSKLRLSEYASGRLFISFYLSNKRYRFSNGSILGYSIKPNLYKGDKRNKKALDLLALFKKHLDSGWSPETIASYSTTLDSLKDFKPSAELSTDYKAELIRTRDKLIAFISQQQ